MFSMRHRLWRMKFWRVWLATTGQGSLDNIFKYQNIFIVSSLCLMDLMVVWNTSLFSSPFVPSLKSWRLFDSLGDDYSIIRLQIDPWTWFESFTNTWSTFFPKTQFFQKLLGYWPAEFYHFWRFFRLDVYGTVYEPFRRHNRISSRAD